MPQDQGTGHAECAPPWPPRPPTSPPPASVAPPLLLPDDCHRLVETVEQFCSTQRTALLEFPFGPPTLMTELADPPLEEIAARGSLVTRHRRSAQKRARCGWDAGHAGEGFCQEPSIAPSSTAIIQGKG